MATCKGMSNINILKATHFATLLGKYKIMVSYVFLASFRNILPKSIIYFNDFLYFGKYFLVIYARIRISVIALNDNITVHQISFFIIPYQYPLFCSIIKIRLYRIIQLLIFQQPILDMIASIPSIFSLKATSI